MSRAGVTVLVIFHREGLIAYPTLRSAVLASREATQKGVFCRIIAVIDRGDDITKEQVYRFRDRLDAVHEVDYGDLACSRNHGIDGIDTKYVATLDGDDLFGFDWLWKGVHFLEELGDDNTVGHTHVRLSFGSELHGRIQISTDSHLFHPLNLITSWLYAADAILPTAIFRKYPQRPSDAQNGLGAEDWHWTCESIVEGIRHVIIPETTNFYRRQDNYTSLGSLPGRTYYPTRLLDRNTVRGLASAFPTASIPLADKVNVITGPKERWSEVPRWLEQSVRRACEIELEIYELYNRLSSIPIETPDFFPTVNQLYLRLMDQLEDGYETVVIFWDRPATDHLGLIDGFLAAIKRRKSPPLTVLIVSLGPDWSGDGQEGVPAGDDLRQDSPGLRLRCIDLGKSRNFSNLWEHPRHNLIVRFLLQARPGLVVNLDCEYFDRLIGEFGKSVASTGIRTVRICRGGKAAEGCDDIQASWQALTLAEGNYSLALCESEQAATWLSTCFHGLETVFCFGYEASEEGSDRTLGEALHALLPPHDRISENSEQGSAVRMITEPPVFRPSAPPSTGSSDVTCVLTVRSEGHYLSQTLQAVSKMAEDAARHEISTELVIVADRPGERTWNVLSALARSWPDARVIRTELDDEASARNIGIEASSGRMVAVLTGGDIVSPGWLARAVRRIEELGPNTIIHPQAVVEFDGTPVISYQPDMDDSEKAVEGLTGGEVWSVHALADRDLFRRIPYHPMPVESGYGHSAWHWNCETVAAGCRHVTVAETAIYRRPPEFVGECRATLGSHPQTTLPPTRFLSGHAWPRPEASRSKTGKSREHTPDTMRESPVSWVRKHSGAGTNGTAPPAWDEEAYIQANCDVREAVANGWFRSGYDHYCRYGLIEGRRAHQRVPRISEEMRSLSIINPALGDAPSGAIAVRRAATSRVSHAYRSCRKIVSAARPTHIFVVPWLRPGGAEQSMIYTLNAVLSSPANRVLIVTTVDTDERWRNSLPARCTWLPFAAHAANCTFEDQIGILTNLLINSGARRLHLFYSDLGWHVLRRHAPALADNLKIYVSIFSIPPVGIADGCGYALYVRTLTPHLAGIFTDNERAAAALRTVCGVSPEKITVVKHPVGARRRFSSPAQGNDLVLWASRVDHDKCPDLLVEIAQRLPSVSFHAYGENSLDDRSYVENIQRVSNISYRGPFHGFDSIASAPYMCFLYTSLWDGLPNAVLEAMKSGLLVIASDVGGVAEVLGDDAGVLIRDKNGPEAFADAIERVFRDPDAYRSMAENGSRRVTNAHTETAFLECLRNTPGYL